MRNTEGTKAHVEVHDYLDAEVPQLSRMQRKRRRILERRGFTTELPATAQAPVSPERSDRFEWNATTHPVATMAPSVSEVRAWARDRGYDVPTRGRLRTEIWNAWHTAHAPEGQHRASTRDQGP